MSSTWEGRGSLFDLGTGGTDVSLGNLMASARGFETYTKNIEINKAVKDKDLRAGMRTLYSAGLNETSDLYDDIINGDAVFTSKNNSDHQGKTTVDEYGKRVIDLNKTGNSRLDLAVLMSHEAFRDGLDGGVSYQAAETSNAAWGHMSVGSALLATYGSSSLNDHNNAEAQAYKMYAQGVISKQEMEQYIAQNYDSTQDFWKLNNDGSISWDGKKGLYDEEGNLIQVATGADGNHLGYSESLLDYMGDSNAKKFLDSKGVDTKGMSRKEFAYALMTSSGTEWNGKEYVPTALPGGQGFNSATIDDRLSFMASSGVLEQVAMRDSIIADLNTYQTAVNAGLSASELGRMYSDLTVRMGDFNSEYALQGIGIAPEGRITQQYKKEQNRMETMKDGETQYLSYTHPGIDIAGSEGVYSPGFTFAGNDKLDYAFGMNLIGTNANYLAEHMNPADVTAVENGEFFIPGQRIMDFPQQRFPTDGGGNNTHGHFEVSLFDEANGWGFGNPSNYLNNPEWSNPNEFPGKYEWLDYEDVKEFWAENYSWRRWEPWNNLN